MDFQDGNCGSHLGFPTETVLATFDLQVTPMFPTKFQVNWPLGSGEEAIDFQDGHHLRFLIRTILAIFNLQVTPKLPTYVQVNWPFGSGREVKNRFSRWPPSWISDWNNLSYF